MRSCSMPRARHRVAQILFSLVLITSLFTTLPSHNVYAQAEGPTDAGGHLNDGGHADDGHTDGDHHPPEGEPSIPGAAILPLNRTCIDGTIRTSSDGSSNHTRFAAPFVIVATPFNQDGTLDEGAAFTTLSDAQGRFYLETGLFPARWQIALQQPTGWEAASPLTQSVQLDFAQTHCANVQFQLRQQVTVNVQKLGSDGAPQVGWRVRAQPASGNASTQEGVIAADGKLTLTLSSGLWWWSEAPPTGTTYWALSTNGQTLQSDLSMTGPYQLVINDYSVQAGCIDVYQHKMEPTGEQSQTHLVSWRIDLQRADGALIHSKWTNAEGFVRFSHLPIGSYRVSQAGRSGWRAVAPTVYSVRVSSGDTCPTVSFYHEPIPNTPGGTEGCRAIHIAQPGDSLSVVGAKNGVRFQAMINANPWILNRYKLFLRPGDQVCIP